MTSSLHLVAFPLFPNAAAVAGFSLVGSIVSGQQTMAAIDPSAGISASVGIVITCSVAFMMALCEYKTIHV